MGYLDDILSASKSVSLPLERLNGCNILITGSTGLIGSCLVRMLMTLPVDGLQVYAAGRNIKRAQELFGDYFKLDNFHFICFDILEPLSISIQFQYIVHAASYASPADFFSCPVEVMKSNIIGLANLLDYGKDNGIQRLLYVSSGEVYGVGEGKAFDERDSGYVDCTAPRSCYPSSKRASESLCASYVQEYDMDCVIARPCHIYGPDFSNKDNRAYAQFFSCSRAGKDIILHSSGLQTRSWCYVVDCASALLSIILLGVKGEAYNVADNNSVISLRRFAEICADVSGCKLVVADISPKEDISSRQSVYIPDKLLDLGWQPMFTLESGVKHSIWPY